MKQLFWAIQAGVIYLSTWMLALLPEWAGSRFGDLAGLVMYHTVGRRRRIARDNIVASLDYLGQRPEWTFGAMSPDELTKAVFVNIGRSLAEICRLYHGRGNKMIERLELRDQHHYENARKKGRGLIFLTGHCGNWELLALGFSMRFNETMSAVARHQNNPYLNRMTETMRMKFNNRQIYKTGALKGIMSVIRKNDIVGILVDQAVSPDDGARISFLGRSAWASKLPVILSRKTGAPIVPVFLHREEGRHVMTFYPELTFEGEWTDETLQHDVQMYSNTIERYVVEHPTEWYWVHRRWKRGGEPMV